MSSYSHTKIYENGLCKFIEHHHGETKQFIESGADISYLTNHFFSDSFYLSLVTMAIPVTDDDYLEYTHFALVQEADQPTGNQTHQNYERDDNAIDPYHRQSTRNNLSSLVDSHTSSGFNSLMIYNHSESSLTSYPVIVRNDLSITSVNSGQQNIHSSGYQYGQRRSSVASRSFSISHQLQADRPSSGYQYGQRRSSAASRSFSFSHQLQADRPITEEEQNNGYTASPIPLSAVLRTVRHETRENRLSSGEHTSTVSLHESTCTQRKVVQSSEKTSSRSAENPPDDNSHQQVALATPTTTASSCPRPRDQPRILERSTCSAICNDDSSSNGSKEKCPVWSSRSLSHDMCNINRESLNEQGKQAAQYDTTESICKADESNDCCHRNSNHYGSFDRIQHNGNIIWQGQCIIKLVLKKLIRMLSISVRISSCITKYVSVA
jgi:hypothetical protein